MPKIFEADKNKFVDDCLNIFRKSLLSSVVPAYKETVKFVFQKSELSRSGDNEQLVEQFNELKQDQPAVTDSINSIARSVLDEIVDQLEMTKGEIHLQMADDEDLEVSLDITQMESVLDIKYSRYLHALENRFKVFYANRNVSKSNMPLGVPFLCSIVSQFLDVFDWAADVKIHLVKKLLRHLRDNMLDAYETINNRFAEVGILPNISLGYETAHLRKQLDNRDQASVISDKSVPPNKPKTEENKADTLIQSVFKLMNQTRKSENKIKTTKIDNALINQSMQDLSETTGIGAGSVEMEKFQELLADEIRNKTGIYYPGFTDYQQNVMDILGMLYDLIREDETIDKNIFSSINAINVPLMRIAINDARFFTHKEHPARMFLENIIHASRNWFGTSVVNDLHKLSAFVASDFDGGADSFKSGVEELQSYLSLVSRRADKAEQKWVSSSKGKEKMDVSRLVVKNFLKQMQKYDTPVFISDLLENVLQAYLTITVLRHGESSEKWQKDTETISSVVRMTDAAEVRNLTLKQRIESLQYFENILQQLGFTEIDKAATVENIRSCLQATSHGHSACNIKLKNVISVSSAGQAQLTNSDDDSSLEDRDLNQDEKAQLVKFKLTPMGTVFEFTSEDSKERTRRKLIWLSPLSNKALFVSLLGNKPVEKKFNAIAIALMKKNMKKIQVENRNYFEYAIQKIYGTLMKIS